MTNGNSILFLLKWPRKFKRLFVLSLDILFSILAVLFAFYLRIDQWIPVTGNSQFTPLPAIIISVALSLPLFIASGFYRAIFRYSEFTALKIILKSIALYGFIYLSIFTLLGVDGVPRTVGIIQPILMLLFIGGSRVFAAYWLGGMYRKILHLDAPSKFLIYGSGVHAREVARTLIQNQEIRIIGFVDDDPTLLGGTLIGFPVFESADLSDLVRRFDVTDVLLAIPLASRQKRNEILNLLQATGVSVRTLPNTVDIAQGLVDFTEIRDLDIDDLLGRDQVTPDNDLLYKNIYDATVLITGAGGSIGSELSLQILKQLPKTLVLVDHSEFALYEVLEKLQFIQSKGLSPATQFVPLLASVQDDVRMDEIFSHHKPIIIFHAAAYKHVPLVEANPFAGLVNNVFGTLVIAKMAIKYSSSSVTLISTDKAVRPTNIMGASKRLAEMIFQAFAYEKIFSSKTKFSMVRFGNVLGSSGSVVPKFRSQIQNGGPVTVTHQDVTRYFMTITEASQLVLQAAAMSKGGEVFLLDMGLPIRIADLARRMIELSGFTLKDASTPNGDIEIKFVGLRPGEKLYEELLIGDNPEKTLHPRIMKSRDQYISWNNLSEQLKKLESAIEVRDLEHVKAILTKLVDGYCTKNSYYPVIQ
jgi:FlaA1/EpsC-like NDP-sugar epimerase